MIIAGEGEIFFGMKALLLSAALAAGLLCVGAGNAGAQTRIFDGTSRYSSDVLYTARNGKIYRGNSSYTSDILFTIRNGKIYRGNSSYTSDIVANIRDNRLYRGTSGYTSDVIINWDGLLTVEEFVALWYVMFI